MLPRHVKQTLLEFAPLWADREPTLPALVQQMVNDEPITDEEIDLIEHACLDDFLSECGPDSEPSAWGKRLAGCLGQLEREKSTWE